ncbi:MAG TPA: class I SAM-dependent methyltransferase [Planctomycetota bacterium]|jgi:SAM-dependent methyltransferase|nr:class I SAM-dependent methyltransferase [Planctomycetota bacterium]
MARSPFEEPELFDRVLGNLPYGVEFYLRLARDARGPVLELGCGTGRVLLPCLEAGIDVEGLDLYPPMLERLKAKARAKGLQARVFEGDMRGFHLPRRYALVAIPCNGFAHCLTAAEELSCLRVCREHLRPGGTLAFDSFSAGPKFLSQPEGNRVLEHEAPDARTGGRVRLWDNRSFDRAARIQRSRMEVEEIDASGNVGAVHVWESVTRWTTRDDLEPLLAEAGFPRVEILGDFDRAPFEEDGAMVVLATREERDAS